MSKKCELDREFEGTKCGIDKRIVLVWFLPIFLSIVLFLLLFFMFYLSTSSSFRAGAFMDTSFVLFFVLFLMAVLAFAWFFLRYRSISYTISKNEIVINEGVVNKKRTVIPYNQMQNIHIRKPLLYRLAGIAYIEVETAGSASGFVEGFIPGVANADDIVREILSHVERFRKGPEKLVDTYERETLLEILGELRAINGPDRVIGKDTSGSLRSAVSRMLGDEEKKPKVCLPVETAPPDKLPGDVNLMNEVLRELKSLRERMESDSQKANP